MKLYPLHKGDTKVPYGQFYGGVGDEWTGWRGMWRFLTDKSHAIMVPIYAYLVEHPEHGWVMIDTGINWQQAHRTAPTTPAGSSGRRPTRTSIGCLPSSSSLSSFAGWAWSPPRCERSS
jgi:hypothetical protein